MNPAMKNLLSSVALAGGLAMAVAVSPVRAQSVAEATPAGVRLAIDPKAPTVAQTELDIAAPPQAVWAVLTDFARWPMMMPEISSTKLEGPLAPGSTLRWTPYGAPVESRIVAVEPGRKLVWNGADGAVHIWELVPSAKGTLLRNAESIDVAKAGPGRDSSGSLSWLLTTWNRRLSEYAVRRGK